MELQKPWEHLCKLQDLLDHICQFVCTSNPQVLAGLEMFKESLLCLTERTKSYHSHEVFNFGLLDPNLPLLPDLLIGEKAGSLVRLEDGVRQQIENGQLHPFEGDEGDG